jgi:helix-turn-helix protein
MAAQRDPLGPRDLARVFAPFHNVSYYAPEIQAFVEAGMRGRWMAYFAYRAAPMGAVPAAVVIATFYNFAPRMIHRAVPEVWSVMSPVAAMGLRDHCVDQALRRLLADRLDEAALAEAAQLARASIEGCAPGARVLYAAHTTLPWPHEPHRILWHASTLLREHRGDSHNLALAAAEVDGVQAHILMAARGQGTKATILPRRGWTSEEWDDGVTRLVARGWLHPNGTFTAHGAHNRRDIEAQTDRLTHEPFRRLGPERAQRLLDLMQPYVEQLDGGGIATQWPPPPRRPRAE